jgi:hypothetical protein
MLKKNLQTHPAAYKHAVTIKYLLILFLRPMLPFTDNIP